MEERQLRKLFKKLREISIIVLGDYFLDKYLMIDRSISERSLETGLEAYQVAEKRIYPGAAGTVTSNLKSLGVGKIYALGVIGYDGEGFDLKRSLMDSGIDTAHLVQAESRNTPTYTKPIIIEGDVSREINRLDIKNFKKTPSDITDSVIQSLHSLIKDVDGIVVLDQVSEKDCGVVTKKMRDVVSGLMGGEDLKVCVDSRSNIGKFKNVIIKCNHYEAVKALNPDLKGEPDEESIIKAGRYLASNSGRTVFVTYGSKGQIVFDKNGFKKIPAVPAEGPFDKCGAGDATSSGIMSALCCGYSIYDSALLGNLISSITIQQTGVTGTATPRQVIERYRNVFL